MTTYRKTGMLLVAGLLALAASCATSSGGEAESAQKGTSAYDSGWLPVRESPMRGPDDGLVTVVVFNDLLCGSCAKAKARVEKLRRRRDSVRVVYKYYPIEKTAHRKAARAAAFAQSEGEFWPMYDAIVERRRKVSKNPDEALRAIAEEIGLDGPAFEEAIAGSGDEGTLPKSVERDVELGRKLGLQGPPVVFVNGEMLAGGDGLGSLGPTVERARNEVDRLLKGDVSPALLYQTAAGLAYERQEIGSRGRYQGPLEAPDGGAVARGGGGAEKGGSRGAPEAGEVKQRIPVGESPVRGPSDAPVTVVAFMDLQGPFCKKGRKRLRELRENYPDEVRIVFKHYVLPMHKHAKPAARIALAAREQGEQYFWGMYDRLYENLNRWKKDGPRDLAVEWADEMGLNVDEFENDLRENEKAYDAVIRRDMKLGKRVGVKGTPHFLINGKELAGAQPYRKFEKIVEAKLEQAESFRRQGVPPEEIYEKAVETNYEPPSEDKPKKKAKKKREQTVEMVPVTDENPVRGASSEEALVTVVQFMDFQGPFCAKVVPTVEKLVDEYGDRARFVFKHRPLGFHKEAKPAARAAIAAQMQGKFWEMHDEIYGDQKRLEQEGVYRELAEKLELDVEQFVRDMKSDEVEQRIEADNELARKVDANGTPTLFVNGVRVVGAQPYDRFESVVETQLERAKKLHDEKGLSGEELYEAVVRVNEKKAGGDAEKERGQKGGDERKEKEGLPEIDRSKLKIGDSPVKGPKDAAVTIYEFSNFQCPYSGKARSTIARVMREYDNEVRLVHKHYPLPFHDHSRKAARAAIAAGKQGKYWEMREILFKNQKKLGRAGIYAKWAERLELDVDQFEEEMQKVPESAIDDDMEMGKRVGVKGTPAFFINGKRLIGAQPYSKFESLIDEELKEE